MSLVGNGERTATGPPVLSLPGDVGQRVISRLGPSKGAEGKNPPENKDVRDAALISLQQPRGELKAGASPGLGGSLGSS